MYSLKSLECCLKPRQPVFILTKEHVFSVLKESVWILDIESLRSVADKSDDEHIFIQIVRQ
jgi:hypothetical protein